MDIVNSSSIISYCCGCYPSIGGVARYDSQLNIIFPNRKFFQGPKEKAEMLEYLKEVNNPIVITDNHLACDVPNEYPVLLVHHGCAKTTAERNTDWDKFWKDLCCNGQDMMLLYRDPKNTWIISISQACTNDFTKYYGNEYTKFKRIDILHPSEFDETFYKKTFNEKPIILGNWSHIKKGKHLLPKLKQLLPEFEFKQLNIMPLKNESLENFNKRKQEIYVNSDIFLQIANSEGFSYASNDAMICGLVPVCTNVGGFCGDVAKDAYVELDWKKCYDNIDYNHIGEKIKYAWENRETLSKNAREWYLKNCRFTDWKNKMHCVVHDFYNFTYK
jgi:glycosyltransferase involved in cell wall biosynthesis